MRARDPYKTAVHLASPRHLPKMTRYTSPPPLDYGAICTAKDDLIETLNQKVERLEDNLEDKEEELDRTRCDLEMARANRKCLGKELWRVRCVLVKRVNELERLKELLAVTKRGAGKARRTRKRQRIV